MAAAQNPSNPLIPLKSKSSIPTRQAVTVRRESGAARAFARRVEERLDERGNAQAIVAPKRMPSPKMKIAVASPRRGLVVLHCLKCFGTQAGALSSQLARVMLREPAVRTVRIDVARGEAHLAFDPEALTASELVRRVAAIVREFGSEEAGSESKSEARLIRTGPRGATWGRDDCGSSVWTVIHSIPCRIRARADILVGNRHLASAIERELLQVWGVDNFTVSALTGSVLIEFDPRRISERTLLGLLHSVTQAERAHFSPDRLGHDFSVNCACLPIALTVESLFLPLTPLAGIVILYANLPTLRAAFELGLKKRKIGVDFLDSVVLAGCLATGHLFAASVIGWCLSLGRVLLRKTQDDSQKLIQGAFCKQPRTAWLWKDGEEKEVSLDNVHPGDVVIIHAGESVPVDGVVVDGMGLLDQHSLTGESAPAERTPGEDVFAMTMLLSGCIRVRVVRSGSETTSAKIGQILQNTAAFKLESQSKGERLADKAVSPTLALGTVGLATLGLDGGVAVLNSECGTGIRLAAPLAVLSSLTLCANNGILVKDGRALDNLNKVDTILFDKTGTLTKEQPEVGLIHTVGGFDESEVLRYAAIAEQRFSHPIARAILEAASKRGLKMEQPDASDYRLGFGIQVEIRGRTVRVGSPRYLEAEGLPTPDCVREFTRRAGAAGHSLVLVGIDREIAGAIELQAASRPEAASSIARLRRMGIKHMAVISGDREEPTRRLAESLGLDRYFAQVLPQDKAAYVEKLQREGARVCFVGDGVNDAIALKKADVSVSLRGASSIATDTAQVVLLEDNLEKICEMLAISQDLEKNVKRSWNMIVAPNILCVVGVFTMGFGVFHSVLTNNVAALGALANGMLPLRKAARLRAQKDLAADDLLLHARAHRAMTLLNKKTSTPARTLAA